MDITLVRQGKYNTEIYEGQKIECITSSDISKISKSALRVLYACGKRPLFILKGQDFTPQICVEQSVQPLPDYVLCGQGQISKQSALVMQEQMKHAGFSIPMRSLSALSKTNFSKKEKQERYAPIVRNIFKKQEEKGIKHLVIVADPSKLEAIIYALTGQKAKWPEDVFLQSIKNGKIDYQYNPDKPEYVTEGLLDTMMIHMVNKDNCPEQLKQFSGKVHQPITNQFLSTFLQEKVIKKR